MAYCSNCGAPLAGAMRFCSRCGIKVDEIPKSHRGRDDVMEAEVVDEGGTESDVDEAEVVQEQIDRTCSECDKIAEQKCYFCWANICSRHTTRLQIYINKAPFGNVVVSCGRCADEKHDQQPTKSEAEGASLFFGVKPYHAWKIVK